MALKIIKKTCRFCSKQLTSLYPKQLEYNVKAHELSCKQKIIEETQKEIENETKTK